MKEFKKEYPLSFAAIQNNQKVLKNFAKAQLIIDEALTKNEIISTQLPDLKYYVNDFVRASYDSAINNKYLCLGKHEQQPESLAYLSMPWEARNINSFYKKLKKIPTSEQNTMFKDTLALTEELMNLYEVMEYLKTCTIKASDKKKKETESKKEIENIWFKKLTSHEDSKKVIKLLKETAQEIEIRIYNNYVNSMKNILGIYIKSVENGETNYSKIFKSNIYAQMMIKILVERDYTKGNYENPHYKLVEDYNIKLDNEAKRMASDIVNHFVYKNSNKLSYIVYHKNNLNNVSIHNIDLSNGSIQCDIDCQFKDGSNFIANSSVVLSYSKFGKAFYRYPITFRNVIMPDGKPLTGVSEQKMDEVFALLKSDVEQPKKMKM